MSGKYSCILHRGSKAHKEVREAVERTLARHTEGVTQLHKEKGVYNFYLKDVNTVEEMCAGECRQERHRAHL